MANTALLAAVVRTLMEGRPPSPIAPVPAGPMAPPGGPLLLPPGPAPEPAPIAPMPARDQSLIEQLTGPRPVAPAEQPVSLLQKVALALQGFGAGVQGQGPQFLAGLREERERPQREFRAATEQFEQRRRGAIGVAEEKRQREQQDIQRRADIQSGREFQMFELEQRDRMQEARDLRLQAAALEREEVKARAEAAEQQRKEKEARKAQVISLANSMFDDLKISRQQARALAEHEINGTPLSATDAKIYARLEKYRRPVGGTGTGTGAGDGNAASLERQFNALKARFLRAEQPTLSMPQGDRALMEKIAGQFPAIMNKLEKLGYEVGYDASGIYPYIKPPSARNQPAAQAAGDKTATMEDIRAYMQAEGVDEAEAKRRAQAAGYKVQ